MLKFYNNFLLKIKTKLKTFRKFNALNQIDKKMLDYINFSNGFFIECGANDGVNQSNTWYFEKCLNWHGILIEPLRNKFIELKKNRSKKNYFYNVALSSSVYRNFLNIFENNLESKIIDKLDKNLKLSKVYSSTLTKILDEVHAPKLIDFFSLDVEGFEDEILKGIDFKKYNFKFFLIETKKDSVIKFIINKNYQLIKKLSHHDYLFKLNKHI